MAGGFRRLLALLAASAALTGGNAVAQARSQLVVRMAELDIDPVQLDAYKALLAQKIETSVRIKPGVLSLNAVTVRDSPNQVRIFEVYAGQAAYEAHLNAPHFLTYKTGVAGMVRSLRLLETDPIQLCAKTADGSHCR